MSATKDFVEAQREAWKLGARIMQSELQTRLLKE